MKIKYVKLTESAVEPFQAGKGDAGYDLYAVTTETVKPSERKLISIGIAIEIPEGYYGRIAPRSGLAIDKGIDVMAGVIDSSYRGEIKVLLVNLNHPAPVDPFEGMFGSVYDFAINPGDRIAQLIIERCHKVEWVQEGSLSESDRGESGFGSSGVSSDR